MARFFASHFLLIIGVPAVLSWIAALAWYIGPDTWRHWQTRHARWLDRD